MYSLKPIAIAKTPFQQKFAIPRQAGLVDFPASIELLAPYNQKQAVEGLEQVSHLWIHFIFHQHSDKAPPLQVRPPRLGGNKKLGVFATRSSFRPNALGLSLVKLEEIQASQEAVSLKVRGLDVLDGTPIIDIKPYLPYADSPVDAYNHIASTAPELTIKVQWQEKVLQNFAEQTSDYSISYKHYVEQLISLDPRPAYKQKQAFGDYAMQVFGQDIHWQMLDEASALICACRLIEAN